MNCPEWRLLDGARSVIIVYSYITIWHNSLRIKHETAILCIIHSNNRLIFFVKLGKILLQVKSNLFIKHVGKNIANGYKHNDKIYFLLLQLCHIPSRRFEWRFTLKRCYFFWIQNILFCRCIFVTTRIIINQTNQNVTENRNEIEI